MNHEISAFFDKILCFTGFFRVFKLSTGLVAEQKYPYAFLFVVKPQTRSACLPLHNIRQKTASAGISYRQKPFLSANNQLSLHCPDSLQRRHCIFIAPKSCQPEISFPARAKTRSRRPDDIGVFQQIIKELPRTHLSRRL